MIAWGGQAATPKPGSWLTAIAILAVTGCIIDGIRTGQWAALLMGAVGGLSVTTIAVLAAAAYYLIWGALQALAGGAPTRDEEEDGL